LASSSSAGGRSKAKPRTPAGVGIGALPIPDPRTWPAKIRRWFHDITGDCGTLEVFIFNAGDGGAAFYLHDAITAAGLLGASEAEWHTENGYPAFIFDTAKIEDFTRRLSLAGYIVRELAPIEPRKPTGSKRARVIDIATARKAKRADTE